MKCKNLVATFEKCIQRQHLRVLAFVLLLAGILLLSWWIFDLYGNKHALERSTSEIAGVLENTGNTRTTSSSVPQTLSIPAINLTAQFETPLGVDAEGAVEVPKTYESVGWYKYGPTPGEKGPAVILGHVDSYEGPAVFYSLGQVSPGDQILITRADDSIVTFEVTGFERVEQADFPTDRVYGNLSYGGIRLVTCTGTYDKGAQRYSHNLIVYGKLVSVTNPENATTTKTD